MIKCVTMVKVYDDIFKEIGKISLGSNGFSKQTEEKFE